MMMMMNKNNMACGVLDPMTCAGHINSREFFGDVVLGFFIHPVDIA
jgi:hypothetical protein